MQMFFLISSVCVCGLTPACCFPQWGPEGGLLGPVWQQLRWTQEVGEPEQDLARQNHMEHPGIYLRSYSHSVVIFTPFIEELFTVARCRFLFCKSFILTSLSSFPTDVFIKNYNVHTAITPQRPDRDSRLEMFECWRRDEHKECR